MSDTNRFVAKKGLLIKPYDGIEQDAILKTNTLGEVVTGATFYNLSNTAHTHDEAYTTIVNFNLHSGNTSNPHNVTLVQLSGVSLSVYNTFTGVTSPSTYATIVNLNNHTGNTSNPHNVTTSQLSAYTMIEVNSNFLSANTSFYTQSQSDNNFLSANTSIYWTSGSTTGINTIVGGSDATGAYSIATGYQTTASGKYSNSSGKNTTASGHYSTASGYYTTASGSHSTASGSYTTASGDYSKSKGYNSTASGRYSKSIGYISTASGNHSNARGRYTTASGYYSYVYGFGFSATYPLISSGLASFNHSYRNNTTPNVSGATGNYSAILGGQNQSATHLNSVVLGGSGLTSKENDTVYVPYLNIGNIITGSTINNLGIDSTGKVIIGSTTDLSGYVPYTGSTTAVDLGQNNLTVGSASTFVVDTTNSRVGVNIASPSYDFQVKSGTAYALNVGNVANLPIVQIRNASNVGLVLYGGANDSVIAGWSSLTFKKAAGTVMAVPTGSDLMTLDFNNNNVGINKASPTSNLHIGGNLKIDTTSNVTSATTYSNLVIDSSGELMINDLSNNNFLSANTSFYTQSQANDNFLSASTQSVPLTAAGVYDLPSILDNGDGTVTLGDGEYCFHPLSDGTGSLEKYTITGSTYSFSDELTNYILADYSGGTPIIYVSTSVSTINNITILPILTVFRTGNHLDILNWDEAAKAPTGKIQRRLARTQRFAAEPNGLALGETAGRIVTVTAGAVWNGLNDSQLLSFSSDVDELNLFAHVAGVWTKSGITQYNNNQYDDGTNLATLNPNKYAVNWLFRSLGENSNEVYMVLGTNNYSLIEAQQSTVPPNLPPEIFSLGILLGRIIVEKSMVTATQIDSAFTVNLNFAPSTDHAGLSNLIWLDSNHTGTPNTIAGFDASGFTSEFALSSYYTSTQTNNNFLSANTSFYTQTQVDNLLTGITVDLSQYYTSAQTDANFLSANTSFYTQIQTNNNFLSANTSYYTQTQVDNLLTGITVDLSQYYTSAQTDVKYIPYLSSTGLSFTTSSTTYNDVVRDSSSGNILLNNQFYIGIDFEATNEIFKYTAGESFKINSISNPSGMTYTTLVNDAAYTLGTTINLYDILKITGNTSTGFLKLNSELI